MKLIGVFRALLLALIFLPALVNAPAFSAGSEFTDQFTRKVHAFKDLMKDGGDWMSPQSPWAAYVERQYSQGLSARQQKQYLAFQAEGRCEEVFKLEKTGFLALYPELRQAMSDKIVETVFRLKVAPSTSFGSRRCQAHAMLNPIMEREKKLDSQYYYLTIPGTNLSKITGNNYDPREITLRKAFKILFDLAACEDYKPAINDILEYRKIYLIFVGHDERYYFYVRAKHYGLETPDIDQFVQEMRQLDLSLLQTLLEPLPLSLQLKLSQRQPKIQKFLARGDLDAARKMVFNLTYISCGRIESE